MDIVHLHSSISASDLPPEVRKYLINVDGSDARAYEGTTTSGWEKDGNGHSRYQKSNGTYVADSWLTIDDKSYYMDSNGVMLTDTITPDGFYINAKGKKTNTFLDGNRKKRAGAMLKRMVPMHLPPRYRTRMDGGIILTWRAIWLQIPLLLMDSM